MGLLILAGYMLVSGILTVPWVRTRKKISMAMMSLAKIKHGDRILDLGSGDGSLVLDAVEKGAIGVGIERITWLVWLSRLRARFSKKQGKASFRKGNIFKEELPDADVVFTYLFTEVNERLTPILLKRYPSKTRVVSRDFTFKRLKKIEEKTVGSTTLYLYEIP